MCIETPDLNQHRFIHLAKPSFMTESMKLFIIGKEELDFEYMPKDIAPYQRLL